MAGETEESQSNLSTLSQPPLCCGEKLARGLMHNEERFISIQRYAIYVTSSIYIYISFFPVDGLRRHFPFLFSVSTVISNEFPGHFLRVGAKPISRVSINKPFFFSFLNGSRNSRRQARTKTGSKVQGAGCTAPSQIPHHDPKKSCRV